MKENAFCFFGNKKIEFIKKKRKIAFFLNKKMNLDFIKLKRN